MTEDWKFQVLHKNQIRSWTQREENSRLRDERKELQQSLEQQKQSDFVQLQDSIKERIQQERHREYIKTQEKIQLEKRHIEENKESYRIRREIEEEDREKEKERLECSQTLRSELLRQIGRNKSSKEKMLREKKELEALERKRLDHLLQAENIQRKYETEMSNSEKFDFSLAANNFRKIRTELNRDDNFAFLSEGWRLEKEKIEDKLNLKQKRKEINENCAKVNKEIMSSLDLGKNLGLTEKLREAERRLLWEKDYAKQLEEEKCRKQSGQVEYHSQISEQENQNSSYKKRAENYNDRLEEEMRRRYKHLQEIDDRETLQPIDRVHSLRK